MPAQPYVDLASLDLARVLLDRAGIRASNPQRDLMEQLDAVLLLDLEAGLIAGYRDVRPDEFWVSGHMPGRPLLPGVLMCEAAAQLCALFVVRAGLCPQGYFIGFAGLEAVRFRGEVRPGDRLVLVARRAEVRSRQAIFDAQGFVGPRLVFEGRIIGMRLPFAAG